MSRQVIYVRNLACNDVVTLNNINTGVLVIKSTVILSPMW